jgi:hypothetical protein
MGACAADQREEPASPVAETPAASQTPDTQAAAPAPAPNVPHIYMALQPDGTGPLSVVFAIDAQRNNSPTDDPAIRITPENGKCNPQELRRFNFPPETAKRPIFGPQEATSGITARDLPNFMAMAVTSEMLRQGIVVQPNDSKPQNVCTRKLWERLIVNQSTG